MLVKVKIKVSLCPDFKKVIIDVARLSEKISKLRYIQNYTVMTKAKK